ncbi:MAG: PrsW family intramembrane metalloprotease, partial [Thermoflexia bacterium]
MAAFLLIAALAFVPMLFYALFLWWLDRYEKEPLRFILAAFLWGAVPAVIFSLIAQLVLDVSAFSQSELETGLLEAGLIAPLTEEPFKALMLLFLVLRYRHEIDTPLDGILYGGLVGFGFASTE